MSRYYWKLLYFMKIISINSFTTIPKRVFYRTVHLKSGLSLLLDIPVQLRSLVDVADRYDIFSFDQLGVLHVGVTPIPGAIKLLEYLDKKNKTVILVSNTSSREDAAMQKLISIGFPSKLFHAGVVTSGESAYTAIAAAWKGQKCCLFTWKGWKVGGFLEGLDLQLSPVEDADFLLFQGSQLVVQGSSEDNRSRDGCLAAEMELFETGVIDSDVLKILEIAALRRIPAICANIDETAVTAQGVRFMPGLLVRAYQELGGTCEVFGKPYEAHFAALLSRASSVHVTRFPRTSAKPFTAVHVGDSLVHDITGDCSVACHTLMYFHQYI